MLRDTLRSNRPSTVLELLAQDVALLIHNGGVATVLALTRGQVTWQSLQRGAVLTGVHSEHQHHKHQIHQVDVQGRSTQEEGLTIDCANGRPVGKDPEHHCTDDNVSAMQAQQEVEAGTKNAVTDFVGELIGEFHILVVQEDDEKHEAEQGAEEDDISRGTLGVKDKRVRLIEGLGLCHDLCLKLFQAVEDLGFQSCIAEGGVRIVEFELR
mmetsp:Transcript_54272/g.90464  ORF Transcript_54272/g.90464 Transcript_54272/m.90464 type:complete len:211 (+) Transcript_54272:197-829(+)